MKLAVSWTVALAAAGAILCALASEATAATYTFAYDALGRVISASNGTWSAAYDYDKTGDRTDLNISGGSANQAPVASNDNAGSVRSDQTLTFDPTLNDSDPDGDAIVISAKSNGAKGTVTIVNAATLKYTPTGSLGPDSFTYTITDNQGAGHTSTATVTVSVTSPPPGG